MKKIIILCSSLVFVLGGCGLQKSVFESEKIFKTRPSQSEYLFDYASILKGVEEYSNRYLAGVRNKYSIEALIVSLPSLEGKITIQQAAAEMLSKWKIGRDYGGRGILLLLTDKEKQVKLEVSYELEDVFTDAFCGYIADLQLKPYFLSGQVGTGLLAVMEEIESRSHIKHQGDYNRVYIHDLDKKLLSGGAGAKRDLAKFEKENIKDTGSLYPAGKTVDEAWQALIQSWRDKARDPSLGVYTEITKLIYRDYQNLPDSRYNEDARTYSGKPYEVIQNENYAVIFFGKKEGWENSPFLFCRAAEGWKFDLVHQRKYVRMGLSPYWGAERGNYPYIGLLSRCPYYEGQDIPLEGDDIYTIENDQAAAEKILALETEYKNNPNDFNVAMELGKLYTITSMGPKHVTFLNKAKQLNPDSPLPYKYLAIAHADANYQYKTAIGELKEYIKKAPDDVFGYNFLGYLYYCIGEYEEAAKELNKAAQLRPDNFYAYYYLCRSYGQIYLKLSSSDLRRQEYKKRTLEMLEKAQNSAMVNQIRIKWLKDWVDEYQIKK